jgi:uncharacterized protein (TIGR00251 family)
MDILRQVGDAVELRVKVVPGASRDRIAGPLGDALKVLVASAPEQGKANAAVAGLLAGALGLRPKDVRLVSGAASPRKVYRIAGRSAEQVRRALQLP